MAVDWREKVFAEIRSIKSHWTARLGWTPQLEEADEQIDLYVRFMIRKSERLVVLRLRYEKDFETAGRREAFVDAETLEKDGPECWPTGVSGFNPTQNPRTICLEGTWGFHSYHHRDRDGRRANLNKLLMEMQKCLNP
jgi:hypothetical protein